MKARVCFLCENRNAVSCLSTQKASGPLLVRRGPPQPNQTFCNCSLYAMSGRLARIHTQSTTHSHRRAAPTTEGRAQNESVARAIAPLQVLTVEWRVFIDVWKSSHPMGGGAADSKAFPNCDFLALPRWLAQNQAQKRQYRLSGLCGKTFDRRIFLGQNARIFC